MLHIADAALLIGDPALLALEARDHIEQQVGPCLWIDLAHEWQHPHRPALGRRRLGRPPGRPSVPQAIPPSFPKPSPPPGSEDLNRSRDQGLAHIDALVREWTPRIALSPAAIQSYLTQNIHYHLDPACVEALLLFRRYAAEIDVLPPLPVPRFL